MLSESKSKRVTDTSCLVHFIWWESWLAIVWWNEFEWHADRGNIHSSRIGFHFDQHELLKHFVHIEENSQEFWRTSMMSRMRGWEYKKKLSFHPFRSQQCHINCKPSSKLVLIKAERLACLLLQAKMNEC